METTRVQTVLPRAFAVSDEILNLSCWTYSASLTGRQGRHKGSIRLSLSTPILPARWTWSDSRGWTRSTQYGAEGTQRQGWWTWSGHSKWTWST